ncbi:Druantia anti-phage system protein DruA [Halorarum halobium]|uniref:Druantia anti-phage system protein DruA n=1 Tax=Halorarum halobium TaxID=3075121 RepID=UPI0028AD5A03|nr:Druantia anti-phage system protein DruA [Halobaculum sp. XH14]
MGETFDREVDFSPTLPEEYQRRFDALTDELIEFQEELDREVAIRDEIRSVEQALNEEVSEGRIRYLAALEVLLDLIEIDYDIRKNSELHVVRPDPDRYKDDPEAFKEQERTILQKERRAQFKEESVREFVRKMERDNTHSGNGGSILDLITDGPELYQDLAPLQDQSQEEIAEDLGDVVQPYIQEVVKGEKCPHTGLDLMDIWRYFRYTWLTPYNTVPGRNINFLIRNGAKRNDPIMGIASLASPMMNLSVRDNYIGWRIEAVEEQLQRKKRVHEYEEQLPEEKRTPDKKTRTVTQTEWLETEEEYEERVSQFCSDIREALVDSIRNAIANIRYDDFVEEHPELSDESFVNPDEQVIEILEEIEQQAEQTIEDGEDENPEKMDSWEDRSETALFRKKRARALQKLLRDRKYFQEHSDQDDEEFIHTGLNNESGRRAIKTALKELKKERVGAGMMNIMVCGAIPPYNRILGGKLVAMALTGPKVINMYQDKYGDNQSEIASSMKGEALTKPNELVFLDTTGLFEIGSAQYDRVRVPTERGRIEYDQIGYTEGYGSIQFGPKTRKRLSQVTQFEEGRKVVRGRFGEGVSPRIRKIRRGLKNCGLETDLLKHESRRIVYGIDLAENAQDYLLGIDDDPEYYWPFEDPEQEQQSIYQHWIDRWASMRAQKTDILENIHEFDKQDFKLSSEIDFDKRQTSLGEFIISNS